MRIEIIAIGSELTAGVTVDTNSAMISGKLRDLGIEVSRITLISDLQVDMEEAFAEVFPRADIAIVTGGLGPTEDDRTRFAAAKYYARELVTDEGSVERLKQIFQVFGRTMPESNIWQAMFPEGAMVLENPVGTARGFGMEVDGKLALFAPGVPREVEAMMDHSMLPLILDRAGQRPHIATVTLHSFGLPESELADRLKDYVNQHADVELAYSAKFPNIDLRMSAQASTEELANAALETARKTVETALTDSIYGQGKQTLAEVAATLLTKCGLTVATAESCTGGMIAAALTDISGSSNYFAEGAVTYSNEAKMRVLGVKGETLETYGAVSEQTAIEMAEGLRKSAGTDIALSVTGIAGPTGGTKDKPVGTVHMALAHKGGVEHWVNRFPGGRMRVRKLTTFAALDRIRRYCLGLGGGTSAEFNCTD